MSSLLALLTDAEILAAFFETGYISDRDDEIKNASDDLEEEPVECPGKTDLLSALELLQKFSLLSATGDAFQVNCLYIDRMIIKNYFQL